MHEMHRRKGSYTWLDPPKFEPPVMTGLIVPSHGINDRRTGLQQARLSILGRVSTRSALRAREEAGCLLTRTAHHLAGPVLQEP